MLVYNIIEKMDGNAVIGIKRNGKHVEWYGINDEKLEYYHGSVVSKFHVEPNLEDNGSINWKNPCRIVIEIEDKEPYIGKESMRTLKMLENWLGGK